MKNPLHHTSYGLFALLCLFFPFFSSAQQAEILGGDISYTSVGKGAYHVKLNIYTPCNQALDEATIQVSSVKNTFPPFTVSAHQSNIVDLGEIKPCLDHDQPHICGGSDPTVHNRHWHAKISLNLAILPDCEFIISYRAPHRSQMITTGAAGEPFYIEAYLNTCDQLSGTLNSPEFVNEALLLTAVNLCVSKKNNFYDADMREDNVAYSYELVYPLRNRDSAISFKSGYSYLSPIKFSGSSNTANKENCTGFEIDKKTGELHFKATRTDVAPLAIRLNKYMDGELVSYVTRDLAFGILEVPDNRAPNVQTANKQDTFYLKPDSLFSIKIISFDPDTDDHTQLSAMNVPAGMQAVIEDSAAKWQKMIMEWRPKESDRDWRPYMITLLAYDNSEACPDLMETGVAQKNIYLFVGDGFKSSIDESDTGNSLALYPNPAADVLHITAQGKVSSLKVMDVTGKAIPVSFTTEGDNMQADISHLPKGSYILQMIYEGQAVSRQFFRQ